LARFCRRALAVLAVSYAVAFLGCVAARLSYGYELSWMESGMQAMVDRLQDGRSMYAAPSSAYVPFIYPPLYFVLAYRLWAFLGAIFGAFDGPIAMRALSAGSTLGTAALVYVLLGRQGQNQLRRLLWAALVLAFYGRFRFWQDTSRVDSVFVLLTFGAVGLLYEGRENGSAAFAGFLGGLAITTKQPALPLLLGCGAVHVFVDDRYRRVRVLLAAIVAIVTVVATLGAEGELTNPWFYYYVLRVPSTHPLVLPRALISGIVFVAATMPLFVLTTASALRGSTVQTEARARVWACAFSVAAAVELFLRLKEGASINFFLPLLPIGVMASASDRFRFGRWREPMLLAQFLILLYNPIKAVPSGRDWRAGVELVAALRSVPGDVFLPQFPRYLALAGKSRVAHETAVCDLRTLRPDVLRAIDVELQDGRYAAAVPAPDDENTVLSPCRPHIGSREYPVCEAIPTGSQFFDQDQRRKMKGLCRPAVAAQ